MRRLRTALASPWLKLVLSGAVLAVLLAEIDTGETRAALAAADWRWLALALAVNLASQTISAARWWLLTRAVGFEEPLRRVMAYYFSGMYLNVFGPGTVTGDVGRGLFLAAGQRRALALTTVVAHRLIGFMALILVVTLGVLSLRALPLPVEARWLAALAVPILLVAWVVGPRTLARLLPAGSRWRTLIDRDLAPYWRDRRLLVISLLLAATVHGLQISAQMAVAHALGLAPPWAYFWVIVPLINAAATLPVTFSGVGVREAGYLYALSWSGLTAAAAISVGLLSSAVVLLTGLCGLPAILLTRLGAPPPAPSHPGGT